MAMLFSGTDLNESLECLFNTRCHLSIDEYLNPSSDKSFLEFGLPDFSRLSMAQGDDSKILCRVIERALEAFEPRLSQVKVSFNAYDPKSREAKLVLEGLFQQDDVAVNILLKVLLWEFAVKN
jgi:type VI secretion system protein ImpF